MRRTLKSSAGFTLIELLVALFIMALLAGMSWRGIDGMARAQATSRQRADQVAAISTALAQWQTDLDQVLEIPNQDALDFDGRVLRMTRKYGATDLRVVGWTRRSIDGQTRWLRWQSDSIDTRAKLLAAWSQVQRWAQNPSTQDRERETSVASIDDWQIFYVRNGAFTNPQSSSASATAPGPGGAPAATLPDGVRLVLTLSSGQPVSGSLTKDWMRPNL